MIYKDDHITVGGASCLGVKMASSDVKWLSDTKHDDQWKNSCQLNKYNTIKKVGAGYQPAHVAKNKNNNLLPQYSLVSVLETMKERMVRP